MLTQFLVGGGVTALTLVFHALALAVAVVAVHRFVAWARRWRRLARLLAALVLAGSILMTAHMAEVAIWAGVYWLLEVPVRSDAWLYFAFVNYTTLGYGDVVPRAEWELIGPMTAADGIMLFGLTTALLIHVLNTADDGRPPLGNRPPARPPEANPPAQGPSVSLPPVTPPQP